jgi:molybdopterin converting factor small subunit
MQIIVKLFATFREGRQKIQTMELEEGTTPKDIFKLIGIDKSEVAILLINGRDGKPDSSLKDKDTLSLFPPVRGG